MPETKIGGRDIRDSSVESVDINLSAAPTLSTISAIANFVIWDSSSTSLKTANISVVENYFNTKYPLTSDSRLSNSRPASDVFAWAKASVKPDYTKSEIGLGSVDNTSDASKYVNYATTAGGSNQLYFNLTGETVPNIESPLVAASISTLGYGSAITSGNVTVNYSNNRITAGSFKKSGGLASQFLMADGSTTTATASSWDGGFSFGSVSGYQKFSNGLIIQWGILQTSTNHNTKILFHVAFPTGCRSVQLTLFNPNGNSGSGIYTAASGVKAMDSTGFYGGSAGAGDWVNWYAIGN